MNIYPAYALLQPSQGPMGRIDTNWNLMDQHYDPDADDGILSKQRTPHRVCWTPTGCPVDLGVWDRHPECPLDTLGVCQTSWGSTGSSARSAAPPWSPSDTLERLSDPHQPIKIKLHQKATNLNATLPGGGYTSPYKQQICIFWSVSDEDLTQVENGQASNWWYTSHISHWLAWHLALGDSECSSW